jgi:hypothetical protein
MSSTHPLLVGDESDSIEGNSQQSSVSNSAAGVGSLDSNAIALNVLRENDNALLASNTSSSPAQKKKWVNKKPFVKNMVNMINAKVGITPSKELYTALNKEAKDIFEYFKSNKTKLNDNEIEKIFKYYVYFKVLAKIANSGGTKSIKTILYTKDNFNTNIFQRYIGLFDSQLPDKTYSKWFNEFMDNMQMLSNAIYDCLNNLEIVQAPSTAPPQLKTNPSPLIDFSAP